MTGANSQQPNSQQPNSQQKQKQPLSATMSRGSSLNRRRLQQPSTALVANEPSLRKCRLKNLLVITWGMLLPICPTILFTLQAVSDHNQTARPTQQWEDYLKISVEQSIEGNEEETTFCGERYSKMIMYFKRWIDNHNREQDEQLRRKCNNDNRLCTYWAAIGECRVNPTWMEEHCILACQRCDKLIDEEF